jgi:hypothetical protein
MNSQYHSSNERQKNGQIDTAVEAFSACARIQACHTKTPRGEGFFR